MIVLPLHFPVPNAIAIPAVECFMTVTKKVFDFYSRLQLLPWKQGLEGNIDRDPKLVRNISRFNFVRNGRPCLPSCWILHGGQTVT